MSITALSISDILIPHLYSTNLRTLQGGVDLVISCGDLPYYYLEYIVSTLDIPLFYVRGNHDSLLEYSKAGAQRGPLGAVDLHREVVVHDGLLLGGVQGSLRYSQGAFQYTQAEMWMHVFRLLPEMFFNKIRYGRFLDIFVTHAPPWGIHDQEDPPHRGIRAFRWLIRVFQPTLHFHGHIHVYHPETATETRSGATRVINTYGYRRTQISGITRTHLSEKGRDLQP